MPTTSFPSRRRGAWRLPIVVAVMIAALIGGPGVADAASVDPATNDFTLAEGETFDETLTVTLDAGLSVGLVDVYLLADTTGSMSGPITAVKAQAADLLNNLDTEFPDIDFSFGVGDFKDFPSDPYAFRNSQSITSDHGAVQTAIDGWSAAGGNDGPEGQLYAFDQLAEGRAPSNDGSPPGSIGWRDGARRVVVVFADAPGHDPVCSAVTETVPGHGVGYDITEASVTDKLTSRGMVVIALSTTTGAGMDADPGGAGDYAAACGPTTSGTAGQATRIGEATGGTHIAGLDNDALVAAIEESVTTAVQQIDTLTIQPTGDTADFVESVTPEVRGPISTETEQVVTFDVSWLGKVAATAEDQVFTGTLDVVADGVVVASKTVRITVPGTGGGGTTAGPARPISAPARFTG